MLKINFCEHRWWRRFTNRHLSIEVGSVSTVSRLFETHRGTKRWLWTLCHPIHCQQSLCGLCFLCNRKNLTAHFRNEGVQSVYKKGLSKQVLWCKLSQRRVQAKWTTQKWWETRLPIWCILQELHTFSTHPQPQRHDAPYVVRQASWEGIYPWSSVWISRNFVLWVTLAIVCKMPKKGPPAKHWTKVDVGGHPMIPAHKLNTDLERSVFIHSYKKLVYHTRNITNQSLHEVVIRYSPFDLIKRKWKRWNNHMLWRFYLNDLNDTWNLVAPDLEPSPLSFLSGNLGIPYTNESVTLSWTCIEGGFCFSQVSQYVCEVIEYVPETFYGNLTLLRECKLQKNRIPTVLTHIIRKRH